MFYASLKILGDIVERKCWKSKVEDKEDCEILN
jgi:hypothetical protein